MNPYHRFLMKNRIYCESRGCLDTLTHATNVLNVNGRDTCLCDEHRTRIIQTRCAASHLNKVELSTASPKTKSGANRLKAARKSDEIQDLSLTETKTPNQTT